MSESSPYYSWDGSSVGSLHRRIEQGESITSEDLARILEANPGLVQDAVLGEQILLALRGELKGTPGRPARFPLNDRDLGILYTYEDLLPRLQAWARKPHSTYRGYADDRSPAEFAYYLIARRVKPLSEGSIRNIVSSLKKLGI